MLLSNGSMNGSNPGKLFSFTNAYTTDWGIDTDKGNWNKNGMLRNFSAGEAAVGTLSAMASRPSGTTHPVAWVLAQKAGRISSRGNCFIVVEFTGDGQMGRNLETLACTITIDADAVGQLVMGGAGLATIVIDADGTIFGTIGSEGLAAIEIGAVLGGGALAWLAGNGPIEITGLADPHAIGWMEGTTEEGGMTPAGIADAVWNAMASAYTAAGSFGNLVTFIKNIEGGKLKIVGNQMIFYADDNVTEVARFNLFDSAGNPAMANVFERRRT